MRVTNTKTSPLVAMGMAVEKLESEIAGRAMPIPEYQGKNPFGESIFKWKTTEGLGAWWIVAKPLGDEEFSIIAANPDPARNCGEERFSKRDHLDEAMVELMRAVLARESCG